MFASCGSCGGCGSCCCCGDLLLMVVLYGAIKISKCASYLLW